MEFQIQPIGYIRSERKEMIDDNWKSISSRIELVDEVSEESVYGLEDFSHIEIIFYFHKVEKEKIILKAEHPRENPNWPRVGIFAQRKKNRPNQIGTTISKILKVEKKSIFLETMDAIDGTPVIDIKPVLLEFLPDRNEIKEPKWAQELMRNYW